MNLSDSSSNSTQLSSGNEIYTLFKNAQLFYLVLGLLGAKVILSLANSAISFSIVYVTWKNSSLHGTCNLLIAFNAFCSSTFLLNHITMFGVALISGGNRIPIWHCFLMQSIPLFFNNCQYCSCLAIAFERLMATAFPFWYMNVRNKIKFMAGNFACFFIFASFVLYSSATTTIVPIGMTSNCSPLDLTPTFVVSIQWAIIGTSICCYLLLGLVLKKTRNDQASSASGTSAAYTRHIFKAIALVALLEVFGWGFNAAYRLFMSLMNFQKIPVWIAGQCVNFVLVCILAMNGPVLYWSGSEYRKAYQNLFPFLIRSQTSVTSLNRVTT